MFELFFEYEKTKAIGKKLIDQFGKIKVYSVNGDAVRNSSKASQEFGGSSTHYALPKTVPQNEIWIEDDVEPKEQKVMIASCLYQLANIRKGMSYDKAYDLQIKKEKDYRDSVLLSKKNPEKTDETAPKSIYLKKYGHTVSDDIEVWLVSGEKVRNNFKCDWIEGGHGYVYDFVPNKEIWLEFGMHDIEYPFILLHEYTERILMKYRNTDYDHAHEIAAKVEWEMRCDRSKYSKNNALSLSKSEVFTLVEKYLPRSRI